MKKSRQEISKKYYEKNKNKILSKYHNIEKEEYDIIKEYSDLHKEEISQLKKERAKEAAKVKHFLYFQNNKEKIYERRKGYNK